VKAILPLPCLMSSGIPSFQSLIFFSPFFTQAVPFGFRSEPFVPIFPRRKKRSPPLFFFKVVSAAVPFLPPYITFFSPLCRRSGRNPLSPLSLPALFYLEPVRSQRPLAKFPPSSFLQGSFRKSFFFGRPSPFFLPFFRNCRVPLFFLYYDWPRRPYSPSLLSASRG